MDYIYILFYIMFFCFILGFLVHVVSAKNRKKKINSEEGGILNRKTIIADSQILGNIFFIPFLIIFIVIFLILVGFLIYRKNVISLVFTCIIVIPIVRAVILSINGNVKTLHSKYVIVIDELKDKYCVTQRDSDGNDISYWKLYFNNYFQKYNDYVSTNYTRGKDYKIGDQFYLVFFKGSKSPYIFSLKNYTLPDSEKDNLRSLDEARDFINLKEFVLESNEERVVINKKRLKKEFKSHTKTAIINTFLSIAFISLFYCVTKLPDCNLLGIIVIGIFPIVFILMAITKIIYVCTIFKNINKENVKIKIDTVKSLNNNVDFKDSNEVISFKFENYRNLVYNHKEKFLNAKIGDQFYLVFVKGADEPLIYSLDRSTIGEDLISCLKIQNK